MARFPCHPERGASSRMAGRCRSEGPRGCRQHRDSPQALRPKCPRVRFRRGTPSGVPSCRLPLTCHPERPPRLFSSRPSGAGPNVNWSAGRGAALAVPYKLYPPVILSDCRDCLSSRPSGRVAAGARDLRDVRRYQDSPHGFSPKCVHNGIVRPHFCGILHFGHPPSFRMTRAKSSPRALARACLAMSILT